MVPPVSHLLNNRCPVHPSAKTLFVSDWGTTLVLIDHQLLQVSDTVRDLEQK